MRRDSNDSTPKTYKTKTYYTRIKNNDPVVGGGNKYVQGVISGILRSVCKFCTDDDFCRWVSKGTFGILVDKQTGDTIYRICTTDELYNKFKNIVEKEYPNICDFDIYD